MKKSLLALTLLTMAVSAHATYCPDGTLIASHPGGVCPTPSPPPPPPPPPPAPTPAPSTANSKSVSGAVSGSKATAGAKSSSSSKSSSVAKQDQSQTLQSSVKNEVANSNDSSANNNGTGNGNDNSQNKFQSLLLTLPQLAYTPPLPQLSCPESSASQSSTGVLWGLYSRAEGGINTDNCSLFRIYNAYLEQCKFASAEELLDKLTVKLLPTYTIQTTQLENLNAKDCMVWKNPPPPPPPKVECPVCDLPPPPPPACPVTPPPKKTTKAIKKPQVVCKPVK